jgi:hypothetical protein
MFRRRVTVPANRVPSTTATSPAPADTPKMINSRRCTAAWALTWDPHPHRSQALVADGHGYGEIVNPLLPGIQKLNMLAFSRGNAIGVFQIYRKAPFEGVGQHLAGLFLDKGIDNVIAGFF